MIVEIVAMRMSILLYDGFTTLDIVGGYESLARIPGMQTEFVAKQAGIYAADTRALGLYAGKTLEDAKGTDILYVPGGLGVYAAQRDPQILDFIRTSHQTTAWTVGICNGAEILAASGILDGVEVTTNYLAGTGWQNSAVHDLLGFNDYRYQSVDFFETHRSRCECTPAEKDRQPPRSNV